MGKKVNTLKTEQAIAKEKQELVKSKTERPISTETEIGGTNSKEIGDLLNRSHKAKPTNAKQALVPINKTEQNTKEHCQRLRQNTINHNISL